MMSRSSTASVVIPQVLVFSSSTFWISCPRRSRSDSNTAKSFFPMAFRRAVCADNITASSNPSTSSTAFSGSHTIQNPMASTLTGTVSAVSVVSALKSVTRTL